MECDRTGVYETYYIPKDQTDKSCYMKIDYVNFERKNQNHTEYCKFSDFDRERIQPVEEFLFHKEIKEFINMENKCLTIPNPKSIEKLENFDDTSLKNTENYDVYYKSRIIYNRDQKKFLQFLRNRFYYYSDHIDPDFIDAYKTVLENMNSLMNKPIIVDGYYIERYICQETLGSHRTTTVYRFCMVNGSKDKEIASITILSDDDVTAYRIMVDDRVFKQKFLVIYTQEYSNEKFEYKLYFDPVLELKENQYSTKLYLSQVNRKWYREMMLDRDTDDMKIEITINTSQPYAADKDELTIKHKHEMDKTLIGSYLRNRFKLDSSNATIQIISNSLSDYRNMNLYSKAEIKLVNGNVARGNLVIRAKGSHYIPDEYFFNIDYDSIQFNKWKINFHFNESSGLVTESSFPVQEKMKGFVTTEYLNTIESNIRNGKFYLSDTLYDLRYLIIPELMKNNKEGFIFFDFRNAMIHFEEDTIARKFL